MHNRVLLRKSSALLNFDSRVLYGNLIHLRTGLRIILTLICYTFTLSLVAIFFAPTPPASVLHVLELSIATSAGVLPHVF